MWRFSAQNAPGLRGIWPPAELQPADMAVAAIQSFFVLVLTFLISVVEDVEVFGNEGGGVVEAGTGLKQRLCAPSSLLCNSSSFSRPPKCDTLKGSGCVREPCFLCGATAFGTGQESA